MLTWMRAQIWRSVFGVSAGVLIASGQAWAGEPIADDVPEYDYFADSRVVVDEATGNFRFAKAKQQPEGEAQAEQPVGNPQQFDQFQAAQGGGSSFVSLSDAFNASEASGSTSNRLETPSFGGSELFIPSVQEQSIIRSTRDVGSVLIESPSATGVSLFRRSQGTRPYIRGYSQNQIVTQLNGGYWTAARPDLDTIVSKIDSGIVQDVIIIQGPYSALYGPGLSFIDVVTAPTYRSCEEGCVISEWRTVLNGDSNGRGYYAREAVNLGGYNYGVRANVGFRGQSDYRSGNGTRINSAYKARDIDFAAGYDLSDGSQLEFHYVRLDVDDAEMDNQPANIDFQVTNGFLARYTNEYGAFADKTTVEAWYNETRIGQNAEFPGVTIDPTPPPLTLDIAQQTYQNSLGGRYALTFGDVECDHTIVGVDVRSVKQSIQETDQFREAGATIVGGGPFEFDVPNSEQVNPGLFIQREVVVSDPLTVTYGGRLDQVYTSVGQYDVMRPGSISNIADDRDFTLFQLFAKMDLKLTDALTGFTAVGHGQRAPNLIELYADEPFIAGYQYGYAFFTGNPNLDEERATQVDVGVTGEYDNFTFLSRAYYSYVDNFITVADLGLANPIFGPAQGFQFVNSDSSFAGFEVNGDYAINDRWSTFANMSYTYGRDEGLFGGPVYGVYPLQSRVGFRYEAGDICRGYGVELSARLVDDQDRIAADRTEFYTPGFQTMDLRTYWRLQENWVVTAGVTNLTDRNYFEHFDYHTGLEGRPTFQPGANFYAGTEIKF